MSTSSLGLWLERSRLDGMVLGGVSYGVYLLLTIQSLAALTRRPRQGGKIADNRLMLISYIVITFILGTLCFAANARYTQMIWIDLRNVPGGPLELIENEMAYRINVLAISSGHVQEWFMQALLLYRCFVVWNRQIYVAILMISLYIAMIGLSIFIQVKASKGIAFYNIGPAELAYLCITMGFTVIYTFLVAYRLLVMRRDMKQVLAQYDSSTYDAIVMMIVESAAVYSIIAILFIVAFALHYNGITTMCFLSIGQLQGIAQLLIIIRVATGRAVTHESTRMAAPPTTLEFSGATSDITEESDDQRVARPGRDIVHTYSTSKKAAEAGECIV
ncbi:hypothetical protein K503DRAFT_717591 [Rhizopogon vinicolor AM-OR11-026]|uniref:Uncharacterized protein n=1 Tax=Rhizopogon vinicolor AM-OR11-026 TaxID=1314800 RepID=A0A1B7N1T5_9AGAM|nr:hypothetical protein K503DRAFT_717591 [Rhizopogon vinicolor AM-OR11-026]